MGFRFAVKLGPESYDAGLVMSRIPMTSSYPFESMTLWRSQARKPRPRTTTPLYWIGRRNPVNGQAPLSGPDDARENEHRSRAW